MRVTAAQRFLKVDSGAGAVTDREQAAQKLYEELAAARTRKDQTAVLQISTRLVVDYADTQWVKSRLTQIQQLTVPGNDPVQVLPASKLTH